MGKSHSRRQDVTLLTETNCVEDKQLECGIVHAESPKELEAWGLDSNQQAKDERTGRYFQVVSSRSYIPLQIYRSDNKAPQVVGSNVTTIASQTEDEEMIFLEERQTRDSRVLWFGIIAALFAVVISLVVLLNMMG